jgi:hypothetical protein
VSNGADVVNLVQGDAYGSVVQAGRIEGDIVQDGVRMWPR